MREPNRVLRDESGETLVETLVSLLIIAGLFVALATAVVTAANINKQTKEAAQSNEFAFVSSDESGATTGGTKSHGTASFAFESGTPGPSDPDNASVSVDFFVTTQDDSHDPYCYYEAQQRDGDSSSDSSSGSPDKKKKAEPDSSSDAKAGE